MFHTLVLHLQALTRCYIFTFVQFRPASPWGVIRKLWERINKSLIPSHLVVQLWSIFSVVAILSEEVPLCTCTSGLCWIYSTASKWWFLNLSVGVLQPFRKANLASVLCAHTGQLKTCWAVPADPALISRDSEIQNLGQLEAEVWGWWEIAARTAKFVRTGHLGRDLKIAATLTEKMTLCDWPNINQAKLLNFTNMFKSS